MASRKITCTGCSTPRPTPHDDAARGLFERRTYGKLLASAYCDYCGKELNKGDEVIALTIPHTATVNWEYDYLEI